MISIHQSDAVKWAWEEIVGVEMEGKYCEIARVRAEYWEKKGVQLEMFK